MNTCKHIRRTRLVAALVGVVALGTAVTEAQAQLSPGRGGRYDGPRQDDYDARQRSGRLASLETDRTQYPSGRAVQVTLRFTNQSSRAYVIPLNDYEYDVTVREARTGATVWQWSRQNSGARRERRSVRLEPGQTRLWRVLWDQTDASGRRVRPGAYRIEGRVYSQGVAPVEVFLSGNNDDRTEDGPWRGRIPRRFPTPGTGDDRYDGDPRRYDGLRGELRASKSTVRAGDTVELTYTVRNDSGRRQTYRFGTSQQYDIEARSSRGRTIWRSSEGRAYTQAQTELTLEPGRQHTYRFPWRVDRDLDEGRYEVTAFLTARGSGRDGVAEARTFVRVESR